MALCTRHCRAGLQIMPSPFDKLRAGSAGLLPGSFCNENSSAACKTGHAVGVIESYSRGMDTFNV
jgi:hypothetical protein